MKNNLLLENIIAPRAITQPQKKSVLRLGQNYLAPYKLLLRFHLLISFKLFQNQRSCRVCLREGSQKVSFVSTQKRSKETTAHQKER